MIKRLTKARYILIDYSSIQFSPKEGTKFPSDATKQAKPFVVRDFVVGTSIAVYGNVYTDGSKFKVSV